MAALGVVMMGVGVYLMYEAFKNKTPTPVAKAKVSKAARQKASTQRVDVGDDETQPVHSFRTLLGDLATLTRNTVCFGGQKMLTVQSTPTPVQRRALSLLGVDLAAA